MKKPIVGIVSRLETIQNQNYIISVEGTRQAIVESGGIPFLILSTQNGSYKDKAPLSVPFYQAVEWQDLKEVLTLCDAIVMPGGSLWYEMDELICQYAIDQDVPLLGICLGMQVLGKVLSGDQEKVVDKTIKNTTSIIHNEPTLPYVHGVRLVKDKKLYQLLQQEDILVNSRHNYHIPDVAPCYISAYSEDGLIEALEVPEKTFIMGVQWHPELMIDYDPNAQKIFHKFLSVSKVSQKIHQK